MKQPSTGLIAPKREIIVYESGSEIRLEVWTDGETMWLTQEQMCRLFGRTQPVIARHIANIFKEGELLKDEVYAKFAYTTRHGAIPGKTQVVEVGLYNLDVIISVGYRVKSVQGTRFRQWATHTLREMLLNKLDEVKRIGALERRMDAAELDIRQVKQGVNYLVKQLSAPPPDPPRRKIGFTQDRR